MKIQTKLLATIFVAGMLFLSNELAAQQLMHHYIKNTVMRGDADETQHYAVKELASESSKDQSSFEMYGVKRLDNGDKILVLGKHFIASEHTINGKPANQELSTMIKSKAENKFFTARFPLVSYQYIQIDENDAKNLLEKIKQLRQNYIDGDTVKIKNEIRYLEYRLNDEIMVSMSIGKGGSSAKYFDVWINDRREVINSDRFIKWLTEFLAW
jgi:hypothetical protein